MSDLPSLTIDTIWKILNDVLDDDTVNRLVWNCLGYRYDSAMWTSENVDSDWRSAYPQPPDFIASRLAVVKLTRSIPTENKQLLKEKLGFAGYKLDELIPRKTRRATIANWLLSYRQLNGIDD
ncbi:MAG: DUF1823 family protein [Phormidesmis sp. CAN_BIN36]|nr:DUF1823 family protein [Phormidesmis sp. CAN_BIN36]